MQRKTLGNDDQRTRHNTGASHSLYGPANNEGDGVWRTSAYKRANLEDGQGDEVDPVDLVFNIEFTEYELERAGGQEVGRSIPGHIFEGVEIICDLRDCSCNDGTVLVECKA